MNFSTLEYPKLLTKSIVFLYSFFETIKSIPAPFYKEEHAYSKEYLSSRSNGYHLWKLTYSSQLNCYVININSKATKYNESGNSSEVSPYYSTLFYDTAFNKLGEIKFKNKSIMTVGRENVVIFKHSDENAPNYDPRKIKMEVYTISKN